jgi:hypothetical protein
MKQIGFDVVRAIDLDCGDTLHFYADGHVDKAAFVQEVLDEEDREISVDQVKHGYSRQYPLDEDDCADYAENRIDFSLKKHGEDWQECTYWGDI